MKWKFPVSLLATIVAAAFVAVAVGQQPNSIEDRSARKDVRTTSRPSTTTSSSAEHVTDFVQDPFSGNYVPDQLFSPAAGNGFPQQLTYTASGAGTAHGFGFNSESSALVNEASVLLRKLAAADSDANRSAIKTQLKENLGKQFDARQKRHEQEIKTLEEKVKKLKELVLRRQESRDEIISRRLDQVLRDAEGLGW
jgi:hypothetical protein